MEASESNSPRVLNVDLTQGVSQVELWTSSDEVEERIGRLGGSSLATALLHRQARLAPGAEPGFVVAIGSAVRAGLPTAARATIASRAPLAGAYADGQVGSDLGRRLASVCDAIFLSGRTELAGAVLHVGGDGATQVIAIEELRDATPARIAAVATERFGECAILRVGRSARAGVRFASLIAGTSPPSLVGRGGLGNAFAQTGLVALVVSAPRLQPSADGEQRAAIDRLLLSSPRLELRAEGGTLELAQARAMRGELTGRGGSVPVTQDEAKEWSQQVDASKKTRHGCAGCPTPCGYVFENAAGERQSARFSVFDALGWNLGLKEPAQALSLLRLCDEWGIDAKETGAILAALARSRSAELFGDLEGLRALLEQVASGGLPEALRGVHELERALGIVTAESPGIAERSETNLAVRLGARVACRGAEPMRTHPFLVDGSVHGRKLESLFAPFALPQGSADPLDPCGKGRLVWWHENLTAAVDASGFCAFSAGSLLADGVATLDELALAVAPTLAHFDREANTTSPGLAWPAAGAATLLLVRELNRLWLRSERASGATTDEPIFANPGMVPEYATWRGLDPAGFPRSDWRERVGSPALLEFGQPLSLAAAETTERFEPARVVAPKAAGSVRIRAFGSLGARIGGEPIHFNLPCELRFLIEDLARDVPDAARSLMLDGEILPAAYRAGERLRASDLVYDGDVVDLILVTAGG